jgi:hypothetical protein
MRTFNSICWPLLTVVSLNPCKILGTRSSARAAVRTGIEFPSLLCAQVVQYKLDVTFNGDGSVLGFLSQPIGQFDGVVPGVCHGCLVDFQSISVGRLTDFNTFAIDQRFVVQRPAIIKKNNLRKKPIELFIKV